MNQPLRLRLGLLAVVWMLTLALGSSAAPAGAASPVLRPYYDWQGVVEAQIVPNNPGQSDNFGAAAALDGDTLVVGAPGGSAAYVFQRTQDPASPWQQVAQLLPAGPVAYGNSFAAAVAIRGDQIAVNSLDAPIGENRERGIVYIYERNQGGPNQWGLAAQLPEPDGYTRSLFGITLQFIDNGLLIGAYASDVYANEGGVVHHYTYTPQATPAWRHTASLVPESLDWFDLFGASIALNGDLLAVGAPGAPNYTAGPGKVFLFRRDSAAPAGWRQIAQLGPGDGQTFDQFGDGLAFDGEHLMVGSGNYKGAYRFERLPGQDVWQETGRLMSGNSVKAFARVGDYLLAASPGDSSYGRSAQGSVYVLTRDSGDPTRWTILTQLIAPDGDAEHFFGQALLVQGDAIIVAAPGFGPEYQSVIKPGKVYQLSIQQRPTPVDDSFTVNEDQPTPLDVLANDTAPPAAGTLDPRTVRVIDPARHGTVGIDPVTGVITYTAERDYSGPDRFVYNVGTSIGSSRTAIVSLTVVPTNDPPFFGLPPVMFTAIAHSPYRVTVFGMDQDPGDTLIFSIESGPAWLQVENHHNGSATLFGTPGDADVGDQQVVVRLTDAGGLSATRAMTITVAPNHPPVFQAIQPQTARQGARYNLTVFAQEPDLGQRLSLRATILPSWLAATTGEDYLWLDGTPALADVGEHVVSLEVTDPGGLTATASFTITVEPDRPEQPGSLVAMPLDPSQVGLRWTDGGTGELGFRVERRPAGGDWATLDQLPANTTVYTDTGLACGAWYDYRVVAFNTNWDSPPSAVSSAAAEQLALRSFAYTGAPVTIAGRSASAADLLVGAAGRILDLDARVDLDHPYVGALSLILRSPTGLELPLAAHVGGAGHNFRGTIFDDEAEPAIWLSQAPFSGRFRPSSPLAALDNTEMAGLWQLRVQNDSGFAGALTGADLRITVPDGCPGVPATPTPTATATSTPTATATSTPTPEPPQVIYVDVAAAGANTGRSWADAHPDLQAALARARAGDALWVRRGTYLPLAGADRTNTFTIPPGVQLYGGFAGGETSLGQRDWSANETILSGDIGAAGVAEDNSWRVVSITNGGAGTILDGVIVQGGGTGIALYNGGPTLRNLTVRQNAGEYGGGLAAHNSSPALSDVVFTDNSARYEGGGMYIASGGAPNLERVQFRRNIAGQGGGIANVGQEMTLRHVTFSDNSAIDRYGRGGAIYSRSSGATIEDGVFENNRSMDGGAIYHMFDPIRLNRVLFRGNTSSGNGGALSIGGGQAIITDVSFFANAATGPGSAGGAIYSANSEGTHIVGATFGGNRASGNGGAIMADTGGGLGLFNAVLTGNQAIGGMGGGVFSCGAQRIVQSTFVGNSSSGEGGGFYTCSGNIPVYHSVFWGNTAANDTQIAPGHVQIDVRYSIVQGGYSGAGNRDADPRFVDADGADGQIGTADDDLRPGAGSPAIDAGDNSLLYPDLITDRVGNQRRADDPQVADTGVGTAPIVDLGAYERLAGVAPTRTPTPTASATATPTPPPLPQVGLSFETDGGLQPIAEGAIIRVPLNNLFFAFNRPLDGYLFGAVRVLAEGDTPGFQNSGCATFDEGDRLMRANFRSIQYQQRLYILRYYTGEPSLPDGRYRVLVCDTVTGGYPLLDGDGDEVPGGSFIRDFTIDRTSPTPTPAWTSTATATPTATASPTPTATVGIGPGATIQITQTTGRAGSVFEARGAGFAPGQQVTVWVNGVQVGGAQAGPGGALQIALATDPAAAVGFYRVTIGLEGAGLAAAPPAATYQIHPRFPLRSARGGATPIAISQAVGPLAPQQIFLPLLDV